MQSTYEGLRAWQSRSADIWSPLTEAEESALTEARRIRANQQCNERAYDGMLVHARHCSAAWPAKQRDQYLADIAAKVEALRQSSRERTDQAIAALAARQK